MRVEMRESRMGGKNGMSSLMLFSSLLLHVLSGRESLAASIAQKKNNVLLSIPSYE